MPGKRSAHILMDALGRLLMLIVASVSLQHDDGACALAISLCGGCDRWHAVGFDCGHSGW